VNFLSDATAIDFRGGERLPVPGRKTFNLDAIGEMLVLRSDGTLEVRNELDDAPTIQRITAPPVLMAPGAAGSFDGSGIPTGEMGPGPPGGLGPGPPPGVR
jgi:hypothetical protein